MGWKDLLQAKDEALTAPWTGGRSLRSHERAWNIEGRLPAEHGWYSFKLQGRRATVSGPADVSFGPPEGAFCETARGYLVGDRLVRDETLVDPDPAKLMQFSDQVFLIEPGLDRFARVRAGRTWPGGPWIFFQVEMPLGPEPEVTRAYEDRAGSVRGVKGVTPALEVAFRMEDWQRTEAARRRAELERLRREEEERLRKERERQEIVERLGDAAGRRAMAHMDFGEAARAALAVGGAEYLDHRGSPRRNEMVVKFRIDQRRFECTCDAHTLRIIDSGICLVDHATGVKGDAQYTLESLPGVIRQAIRQGVLVVFRHVDRQRDDDYDEDYDD